VRRPSLVPAPHDGVIQIDAHGPSIGRRRLLTPCRPCRRPRIPTQPPSEDPMRTLSALVVAAALGFASLAQAGTPVPDLTGTWTGTLSCKGISSSPFLFGSF